MRQAASGMIIGPRIWAAKQLAKSTWKLQAPADLLELVESAGNGNLLVLGGKQECATLDPPFSQLWVSPMPLCYTFLALVYLLSKITTTCPSLKRDSMVAQGKTVAHVVATRVHPFRQRILTGWDV